MSLFLSVVIPAYNEEKRLYKTVISVVDFLQKQNYESEVIIVDDGSTDKTVEVANDLIAKFPIVRLIFGKINRGKGFAVKTGMLSAKGERRLFMDADGSTPISEVDKLLKTGEGADVVIGSRRVSGADVKEDQSTIRLALGWLFRHIIETILPLGIIDSQNGFKLFSAKSANELFMRQTIFGWAFDVEILYMARKCGYEIKEVPIVWVNDKESKVTLKGMVKMLWEVLKVRVG
jgi:dolichyl-phosphate beta-glucosyltransferase